jgi:hypothetical protein
MGGSGAAVRQTERKLTMALKERQLEEVTFDRPGTTVTGQLLRVQKIAYRDGGTGLKYLVKAPDGVLKTFYGSARLDARLHSSDMGKLIEVTFVGLDDTKEAQPGFNQPKIFRVAVDEESKTVATDLDPATITDDDIPF